MQDTSRDPASVPDTTYSNWPIVGDAQYAESGDERATPGRQGGMNEEFSTEVADGELEWVGFLGTSEQPYLYAPQESALYEGELDEDNERIVIREDNRRDVEETSLGEHIEEIGDEHDWEWLSSFAQQYLEGDEDPQSSVRHRDSEFQQRNIAESDQYDLAFLGSHTFAEESGQVHSLERFFNVYLDDDGNVTDIEVKEKYLLAEDPAAERRGGDAELIDENERHLDMTLDTESANGENEFAEQLREWHAERIGWPQDL